MATNELPHLLAKELEPLPKLPPNVGRTVAGLEIRIDELETIGLTATTRMEQDEALREAYALANRVLTLRRKHQSDRTNPDEESTEWYEVGDARRRCRHLEQLLEAVDEDRETLAALRSFEQEFGRLAAGRYGPEARARVMEQLAACRRVLGEEHPSTLLLLGAAGSVLKAQGEFAEAEASCREALDKARLIAWLREGRVG